LLDQIAHAVVLVHQLQRSQLTRFVFASENS
jgi:hypothetical protein